MGKAYTKPLVCVENFDTGQCITNSALWQRRKRKMSVRSDVLLREIAGEWILVPVGDLAERFQGIMSLNGSGLLLWEKLKTGGTEQDLVDALLQEYETTGEDARQGVEKFLEQLKEQDLLVYGSAVPGQGDYDMRKDGRTN